MALNEALLKRLIETPGVSGREEKQREVVREELGSLVDEVRTDPLGSVIGTKKDREDASARTTSARRWTTESASSSCWRRSGR